MVGVHRQLLQVGPVPDAVDAAEPDRGVTGHEDDERVGELLRCPGCWERPDPQSLEQCVGGGFDGRQQDQFVGTRRANGLGPGAVAFHVATVDVVYGQAPKGSM